MAPEHLRDAAGLAAVFGLFAFSWFGWAQEDPPAHWRWALGAGSALGGLTAIAGGLLLWRHWSSATVFDEHTAVHFGIVVGIEVAAAGIGAAILAMRRRAAYISAWIAFVVGVHLFPVAALLELPGVHLTGALITAAAIAAVPIAKARALAPSAVVGATVGPILLVSAVIGLIQAVTA